MAEDGSRQRPHGLYVFQPSYLKGLVLSEPWPHQRVEAGYAPTSSTKVAGRPMSVRSLDVYYVDRSSNQGGWRRRPLNGFLVGRQPWAPLHQANFSTLTTLRTHPSLPRYVLAPSLRLRPFSLRKSTTNESRAKVSRRRPTIPGGRRLVIRQQANGATENSRRNEGQGNIAGLFRTAQPGPPSTGDAGNAGKRTLINGR